MLQVFLSWLVPLLVVCVGVYLLCLRWNGLLDYWNPKKMVIGATLRNGQEQASHGDLIRARWAQLFGRGPSLSVQTGFLDLPTPSLADLFGVAREDGEPEVSVQIQGVDVTGVVGTLRKLVQPPEWTFETRIQTISDGLTARGELKRGSRTVGTWNVDRLDYVNDAGETVAAADEDILNDLIFEMIHDISQDKPRNSALERWTRRVTGVPKELDSAGALAAYYTGQLHFRRYYTFLRVEHLDKAIEALRRLRTLAPDFKDGLLLLGIALIEKDHEVEARAVLDRYLEGFDKPDGSTGKAVNAREERLRLRARLLRETALVHEYETLSNHRAITGLLDLKARIEEARQGEFAQENAEPYRQIEALVEVQLAQAYGLYLAYLRWERIAQELSFDETPEKIRVSDAERQAAANSQDEDKKLARTTVERIWKQHREHLEAAENTLEDMQNDPGMRGQAQTKTLAFQVNLASGVALYRLASWIQEGGADQIDGRTFETAIKEATSKLHEADKNRPSHHTTLVYLGMVRKEPRHDAAGSELSLAGDYLRRAILANPSDFYAHEQLAHFYVRSATIRGLTPEVGPSIDGGIESANRSIAIRSRAGGAHVFRAQLYQMKYELTSAPEEREKIHKLLEVYLDKAAPLRTAFYGSYDPELEWVRLAVDARRFGLDADELEDAEREQRFQEDRTALVDRIEKHIAECRRLEDLWINREAVYRITRVKDEAERLLEAVKGSTADDWKEIKVGTPYA